MKPLWLKLPSWLRDTLERAWWTFLGTFVVVSGWQSGITFQHVDWVTSLDLSLMTTLFSTLKSAVISHTKLGEPGTASAVTLEPSRRGRHARPDEA